MSNPFYVGQPVPNQQFIGRELQVNAAFDQIFKRGHLAVYGGKGMGKTSLLDYIAAPEIWQEQGLDLSPIFLIKLDCKSFDSFTSTCFWRKILSKLKDKYKDNNILNPLITKLLKQPKLGNNELCLLLRKIGQQDKLLVLLLDNYDMVFSAKNSHEDAEGLLFVRELRNLADSEEGQCLSTVVTSLKPLNQMVSNSHGLFDNYLFKNLKPFDNNEMTAFCQQFNPQGMFNETLWQEIEKITDGHPALLQRAGFELYQILSLEQKLDLDKFANDLSINTEHLIEYIWSNSTEDEQMLLMLIALSNLKGRLSRKEYNVGDLDKILEGKTEQSYLNKLEARGVIYRAKKQDKTDYSFTSSMMEWWVIKEIENSDATELARREKLFGKLKRLNAKQIMKVMRLVWERKDAILNAAKWLVKLKDMWPF